MTHHAYRTHLVLAVILTASYLCLQSATAQSASDQAPAQIFVSAAAKGGSPVTPDPVGLTVSIDKQPAQVVSVRPAEDDRLLFAVMVDTSSSERPQEKAIKDAAGQIFQALTNDQSQGYLVLFDVRAYPSKRPLLPSEVQSTLGRFQFTGSTASYDSIAQLCSGILSRSNYPDTPRRVLIILSDGDDNYSHMVADKMEEVAEREGVAIFSLPTYGSDGSPRGLDILKQFATGTGGARVLVNKLSDGVSPLVAAVQGQSVLSVASALPRDGKLHSVKVKTLEKGLSVSVPAHILIR